MVRRRVSAVSNHEFLTILRDARLICTIRNGLEKLGLLGCARSSG